MKFKLSSSFKPMGDQAQAIGKLSKGFSENTWQTLLGITGSGKTFTMANVVEKVQKPTLVIAHNKTLAAQLYSEFAGFFPNNKVEYFVSYFDYYQPESYLPTTDTYIEKDSKVNQKIEQMRLRAMSSLMSRPDTLIVASVSCIYGLGNPKDFRELSTHFKSGQSLPRKQIMLKLLGMQYERNDTDLAPGRFRARGNIIDIYLGYDEEVIRLELFGDDIDSIKAVDPVSANTRAELKEIRIYPAKQFVTTQEKMDQAIESIQSELEDHAPKLEPLFAHRLRQRTKYDMEMLKEVGYCNGIENYSRYFDGRNKGEPPFCLLDYFPDDFLMFIDESHQSIPQIHGMHKGDYSRKKNLIEYGFRLPSAYDNRPLTFDEFKKYMKHAIFVSATPSEFETKNSGQVVKQIIRPTGLLDPKVTVKPIKGQVNDLISEIKDIVKNKNRALVTTLTKRMAENLSEYLANAGIRVRYLHSEIDTIERTEIILDLRRREFDCLVGINLLREGLDIPEVELVAILDADKEGFLRSTQSLIQTIGRAARNENGRVIMYADKMTESMNRAISITHDRRNKQIEFNKKNQIKPKTIKKPIADKKVDVKDIKHIPKAQIPKAISALEERMKQAAEQLRFEEAIDLRNRIKALKERKGNQK